MGLTAGEPGKEAAHLFLPPHPLAPFVREKE